MYALVHGSDLIPFMAVIKEQELDNCFERVDGIEGIAEDGYARYEAHDLKWYDGYSDVTAVNDVFLKSQVSMLLRVGEDSGDEEFYSANGDLIDLFEITHTTSVEF